MLNPVAFRPAAKPALEPPPLFHLTHLQLDVHPSSLDYVFLKSLLVPSLSTLSFLHLSDFAHSDVLVALVPLLASRLRTLALSSKNLSATHPDLIALCPSLTTLSLHFPFDSLLDSLPALSAVLPVSLRHLSLSMKENPRFVDPARLFNPLRLHLLPSSTCPNLVRLVLPDYMSFWFESRGGAGAGAGVRGEEGRLGCSRLGVLKAFAAGVARGPLSGSGEVQTDGA